MCEMSMVDALAWCHACLAEVQFRARSVVISVEMPELSVVSRFEAGATAPSFVAAVTATQAECAVWEARHDAALQAGADAANTAKALIHNPYEHWVERAAWARGWWRRVAEMGQDGT